MEVLKNQVTRTTCTGEKEFGAYNAFVRYDIESGKMPTQINASINHQGDEAVGVVPVRLNLTLNCESMKSNISANEVDDLATGLELVQNLDTWLKSYASELKTTIEGGVE